MMKLSEQYERHITKLNEVTSVKAAAADGYVYTGDTTTTMPWGNAADPTQWIKYSALGLGVLALIFGKPAMLKLFGRKFINQEGKVTRYNVFNRLKDKKALRAAGITKEQMRDIWIKFQKQIEISDQKLMKDTVKNVKTGAMTAKEAMAILTHLVPKGAKNLQYRTLVGFEKIAAAKKANAPAVTAGFSAPVQAPITTSQTPIWNIGKLKNTITKDQLNSLTQPQRDAWAKNPNLTFDELQKIGKPLTAAEKLAKQKADDAAVKQSMSKLNIKPYTGL
jgi:hypothetical protein